MRRFSRLTDYISRHLDCGQISQPTQFSQLHNVSIRRLPALAHGEHMIGPDTQRRLSICQKLVPLVYCGDAADCALHVVEQTVGNVR